MEGVPSENQKALTHMNWDDRLRDARARRAKVLRTKVSENADLVEETSDVSEESPVESKASSFETVRTAPVRPISNQLPAIIEAPVVVAPVADPHTRKGLVGLAFGVGISLGVGIMLFQGNLRNSSPVTMEQAPADVLALDATPKVAEPQVAAPKLPKLAVAEPKLPTPKVVEQQVAEPKAAAPKVAELNEPAPKVTPPKISVPNVAALEAPEPKIAATQMPEPEVAVLTLAAPKLAEAKVVLAPSVINGKFAAVQELTQPIVEQAKTLPVIGEALAVAKPTILKTAMAPSDHTAFGATEALPDVGKSPELVEVATSAPNRTRATELLDNIASARPLNTSISRNGFDKRQVETGSSSKMAKEIGTEAVVDVTIADIEPKPQDPAPVLDVESASVAPPPKAITPEANDAPVWIFASGSVGEDVLEVTQSSVENLNMSVRSVNSVGYKISKNQVRYYDKASAEMAERLALEIGATARDFTKSNANPAEGTLEIYLAGEAIVARSESSVASPVAPPRVPLSQNVESQRSILLGKIRAGLSKQ